MRETKSSVIQLYSNKSSGGRIAALSKSAGNKGSGKEFREILTSAGQLSPNGPPAKTAGERVGPGRSQQQELQQEPLKGRQVKEERFEPDQIQQEPLRKEQLRAERAEPDQIQQEPLRKEQLRAEQAEPDQAQQRPLKPEEVAAEGVETAEGRRLNHGLDKTPGSREDKPARPENGSYNKADNKPGKRREDNSNPVNKDSGQPNPVEVRPAPEELLSQLKEVKTGSAAGTTGNPAETVSVEAASEAGTSERAAIEAGTSERAASEAGSLERTASESLAAGRTVSKGAASDGRVSETVRETAVMDKPAAPGTKGESGAGPGETYRLPGGAVTGGPASPKSGSVSAEAAGAVSTPAGAAGQAGVNPEGSPTGLIEINGLEKAALSAAAPHMMNLPKEELKMRLKGMSPDEQRRLEKVLVELTPETGSGKSKTNKAAAGSSRKIVKGAGVKRANQGPENARAGEAVTRRIDGTPRRESPEADRMVYEPTKRINLLKRLDKQGRDPGYGREKAVHLTGKGHPLDTVYGRAERSAAEEPLRENNPVRLKVQGEGKLWSFFLEKADAAGKEKVIRQASNGEVRIRTLESFPGRALHLPGAVGFEEPKTVRFRDGEKDLPGRKAGTAGEKSPQILELDLPGKVTAKEQTAGPGSSIEVEGRMLDRICEQIKLNYRHGPKTIEMQLEPKNLGKMKILLKMEGEGLVVKFRVDSPEARSYLEHNLQGLKTSLIKDGFNPESIQLEAELNNSSYNQQHYPGDGSREDLLYQQDGERGSGFLQREGAAGDGISADPSMEVINEESAEVDRTGADAPYRSLNLLA